MPSLQVLKAVSHILRVRRHFGFLELKDMCKVFEYIVKPLLRYGAHLWGYAYIHNIEKYQYNSENKYVICLKILAIQ